MVNIKKLFLRPDSTLNEAIKIIDLGAAQIALVVDDDDRAELLELLEMHRNYTNSEIAAQLIDEWPASIAKFVKVMPTDYKRVLQEQKMKTS